MDRVTNFLEQNRFFSRTAHSQRQICWLLALMFALTTLDLAAQPVQISESARPHTRVDFDRKREGYQVTERGPNHRKVERIVTEIDEEGREYERVASYTALSSGMNYFDSDTKTWVPAEPIIEPFELGAVARKGQQKVIFAPDISEQGSIDILNDDGVRIQATVIGLAYFDTITGADVNLATVKSSVGVVVPPNQIIYRDAFDGVKADVLYTYRLTGVEQEVILREQPPEPEVFGLPNLSTRLEVMTEFFDTPEPEKDVRVLYEHAEDPQLRNQMVEPDFVDESLSFGAMIMPPGKAFSLDKAEARKLPSASDVPVGKKWQMIGGRSVLFESVEYDRVEAELKRLPVPSRTRAGVQPNSTSSQNVAGKSQRGIPEIQFASASHGREPIEVASLDNIRDPGYVIDYVTLSGSLTNFTFESGETYFIDSMTYQTNGTLTFEGGTVLKYDNDVWKFMAMGGAIRSEIEGDSRIILTAKDDDSVGEVISGSTGVPSGYYPIIALSVEGFSNTWRNFNNFTIRHAMWALYGQSVYGNAPIFRNLQIENCVDALQYYNMGSLRVYNLLVSSCSDSVFSTLNGSIYAENVTVFDAVNLYTDDGGYGDLFMTNSITVDVDQYAAYTGRFASHNVELSNYDDAFQTVDEGRFYLKSDSPYRGAGTDQINSQLLQDLATKTTHPPVVIENLGVSTELNLAPRLEPPSAMPDLGYHYPAVDYLVSEISINSGATATIHPGTRIGYEGTGFRLYGNSNFEVQGRPDQRVRFLAKALVQEGSGAVSNSGTAVRPYSGAIINCQNANFSAFSSAAYSFGDSTAIGWGDVSLVDCEFYNGAFRINGNGSTLSKFDLVNNLFQRGIFHVDHPYASIVVRNNHFQDCELDVDYGSSPVSWTIEDNMLAHSGLTKSWSTSPSVTADHNGYLGTSSGARFATSGSEPSSADSSTVYLYSGPFGELYRYPSVTVGLDQGSQNAVNAGMYHHTVRMDELAETNSVVDIGLHYPVTGSSGLLLDTDGDGIPNIFEDTDGDGVVDSGETDWQVSENGTTGTPGLQIFTRFE